jgi:hypothetical protein
MDRIRTLIPAVLLAAVGCASTTTSKRTPLDDFSHSVQQSLGIEKRPATDILCIWQNRLQQLPDPTRDGAMHAGIVGQVFLLQPNQKPAEPQGDLTICVTPSSPNPAAQYTREVWHIDANTLKQKVVVDERFGKSIAVFLPWPEGWQGVTQLMIEARYDQTEAMTLRAQAAKVVLDFSGQNAVDTRYQKKENVFGVPDPKVALAQMSRGASPPKPVERAWAEPVPGAGNVVGQSFPAPAKLERAWAEPLPAASNVVGQSFTAPAGMPVRAWAGPVPGANTPSPQTPVNAPVQQTPSDEFRVVIPRN